MSPPADRLSGPVSGPVSGPDAGAAMTAGRARDLFATARVVRLASVGADGAPHLVPMVFALVRAAGVDTVVSAVDHKPKRTTALRRLANVANEPRVSLLADHYAEDWRRLWWVRADGTGRVVAADDPDGRAAVDRLVARYQQYTGRRPVGPVLVVTVLRWTGWAASPAAGGG